MNEFIEQVLSEFVLLESVYKEIRQQVQSNVAKRTDAMARRLKRVEKEIEQNEQRKKKLSFMLLDETLTKSEYDDLKQTLNSKISELLIEKNRTSEQLKNIDDVMLKVVDTLKNLKETYITSNTYRKRIILQAIFPDGFEIVEENERLFISTNFVNSFIHPITCKTDSYDRIKIKNEISSKENLIELAY